MRYESRKSRGPTGSLAGPWLNVATIVVVAIGVSAARAQVPGTPADARVGGSIMNSCFRSSESGSWSSSDKVALQYLY